MKTICLKSCFGSFRICRGGKPGETPARQTVSEVNATETESASTSTHEPVTLRVEPGQTIQEVVDQALPGDTIEVPYAIYKEHVIIDVSDIKFFGIPNEAGEWPHH